jgi:hypothetical protein
MELEVMIRCLDGDRAMDMSIRRSVTILWTFRCNSCVYQAYLEFFVSPGLLDRLLAHIERDSNITYYVINKSGDLRTNTHSEGPNAVTWGVFPGKEIIQPTIVEAVSFMAWKVCQLCPCCKAMY